MFRLPTKNEIYVNKRTVLDKYCQEDALKRGEKTRKQIQCTNDAIT